MTEINTPSVWLILTRLTLLLLTALLGWITYQSNLLLKQIKPDFNLLLSPPETIVRLLLVALCLLLAWLSGLPASKLGFSSPNPQQSIGLGLGLGLVGQILINLLTRWAIARFGRQIYSPIVVQSVLPSRPAEWLPVSLALLPAVVMEELLFRSLWLGAFSSVVPISLLIVGTSFVFGFMHLPQGILGVILTGSINALFCLLFLWTGELLVPLVAHYTINLLQLVVAYFHKEWLENY
jgi:hypothetical protein